MNFKAHLKWLALSAGVCLIIVFIVRTFFPLQTHEWWTLQKLKWSGVESFQSGPLTGLEKNLCTQEDQKNQKDCNCIALIHGLGDTSLTWRKLLREGRLPDGKWKAPVRLVALDLPGSRETPRASSPEAYRARNLAEQVKLALTPLCKDWMIVGNSFGAWVALWLTLDWKEGVRKVVLLGGTGLRAGKSSLLKKDMTVEDLKRFQKSAYANPRKLPDSVWKAALTRLKESPAQEIRAAQTDDDYLAGKLSKLRQPVMVIWGMADQIVTEAQNREIAATIPQGIYRQIEACGHLPQKECPFVVFKSIHQMIKFGAM